MASLNTLRTKGGIIVSVVIGIALIAFLLGDLTSPRSGILGGSKMRVGVINGTKIDYTEYSNQSNLMTSVMQTMYGSESLNQAQGEEARRMAWDALIVEHAYTPGFETLGIAAGDAEQSDMVNGAYISPIFQTIFRNPSTGMFDPELMRNFVANIDADPSGNRRVFWEYLKKETVNQRMMTKFLTLVTRGMMVNNLEVEQAVAAANHSYDARYISLNYNTIADSLVKVNDSQVKSYYEKHKERFHQGESRGIEYVVFDMLPSQEDYALAATYIGEIAGEFAQAADPMQYAQANSQQTPDLRYVKPETLNPALREAVMAGDRKGVYGPVLEGDVYMLARFADAKAMPDSIGAKVIVLAPGDKALADSLQGVIKNGGSFEALALQYSLDKQIPGGDLGMFAPEQMNPQISEACLQANKGDVVTVDTPQGLFVIKVTNKTAPVQKVQIATLTYTVQPSGTTEQEIYGKASSFVAAATGSTEKFNAAVTAEGLTPRAGQIRNTDRNVSGLENSLELVRWAFNAKKGEVSTIMEIDGDYVVATLTGMRHQGIAPVSEVAGEIRTILVREEKARMLAEKMKGESLDAVATANALEVATVSGLQQTAFYIDGAGVEMQLIGAICNGTQTGKLSKPVKGMTGVFLFDVTGVTPAAEAATPESERVRLDAMSQSYIAERINQALTDLSKITDMRVKF